MDSAWFEFALRGLGLLLAALLLVLVLRPAAARVRGAVLLSALLGLIVLPVATRLLPAWRASVLPARGAADVAVLEDPTKVSDPVSPASEPTAVAPALPPSAAPRSDAEPVVAPAACLPAEPAAEPVASAGHAAVPPTPNASGTSAASSAGGGVGGLLLVWFAGALLVLLPWLVGLLRAAAWARAARRLDRDDVAPPEGVAVGVHPAVCSPLTVGLLRATILLPEGASSWPRETLRTALLHEAAHARRRDVLATGVARVACALHWFNPLVWIAAAWMRRDSELACDEEVLRGGIEPRSFAETLVRLARSARAARLHGAGAGWGRSGLERRVEAALRGTTPRTRRAGRVAAVAVLGLAFLAAATLQPTAPTRADEPRTEDGSATVLTVGRAGCDHTTVQAALDAAPPGATVRIEAGTYEETLVVEKPVTLEGAGWTATRLTSTLQPVEDFTKRPPPTIRITGTKDVVLRGLRIALVKRDAERVHLGGAAVDIEGAGVRMTDCAMIPSPASGVDISGDSQVVIERCLVAAVGSVGVAIGRRGAGMPKVRLLDSDVRYGHGRCISIGASCNDVVIEGCRISGSGWHGIRYDNASPTIRRNRITDNVRSGIYASGRTRATIEGNLFADTGMGGVSCWHTCGDVITGNTFAHNAREGLDILGASDPTVTRNVFCRNPVGVRWSGIAGDRGASEPAANLGTVRGNVFWENAQDLSREETSDAANPRLDPVLDADYVLAPDSPARALGVGATDLPPRQSPFPTQPEEADAERLYQEHLSKYGDWKSKRSYPALSRKAAADRSSAASETSRVWLARIRRPVRAGDPQAALKEVESALGGDDATLALAALRTAAGLGSVEYDRDAWRALILPYARSEDPDTRWDALLALVRVKPDPADLPLWIEEAENENIGNPEITTESIVTLVDGDLEGRAADAVLHLLRDGTNIRAAFVIRGLQAVRTFDPRVQARLLEIVRAAPASSYDSAYYFIFIAPDLDPKDDAVVDVILLRIAEGRSPLDDLLRCLRRGLSTEQKKRVAEFLLGSLAKSEKRPEQRRLYQALTWVADADQRQRAETLAGEKGLDTSAPGPMEERPTRRQRAEEQARTQAAYRAGQKVEGWRKELREGKDEAARRAALAKLRAALDSDDGALLRAALHTVAWLGDVDLDRDDFRAAILTHVRSEDTKTRQAALWALLRIQPDPVADLPLWLAEAKSVERDFAEFETQALVQLADGIVEGAVADAILYLLRDGTRIQTSDVVRGLQSFKRLDPRVEARLVERVRAASAESYDSVYFFVFVGPKLDPKSDAVVDLILFRLAEGKYALDTVAECLQTGLSAAQRKRAADRLLEILASKTPTTQFPLFDALAWTVDASHVDRLEALLRERTDLTSGERERVEKALEVARSR